MRKDFRIAVEIEKNLNKLYLEDQMVKEREEKKISKEKKKVYKTDVEETVKDLETLGGEEFWKPKENKNVIRILPPWNNEGKFYFKGVLHYTGEEGQLPVPCRSMVDKPCPLCEVVEKASNKKLAKKLVAKKKFYMNVLVLDNIKEGVKIWGATPKQMKKLRSYLEDPDYGDFTDPDEGREVIVEKDSSGTMPSYEIRMRPKASPIEYRGWEDELHDLDKDIIPEIPSKEEYEELAASLNKRLKNQGDDAEREEKEDRGRGKERKEYSDED